MNVEQTQVCDPEKGLEHTNPLEDLGRLIFRPLVFSALLLRSSRSPSAWMLGKSIGIFVFLTLLVSIAGLPPAAKATANFLGALSESLRPLFDFLGVTSHDVAAFEALTFSFSRFAAEALIFVDLFKAVGGVVLVSALLALAWPHHSFQSLFLWVSYAHGFVVLGLLVPSGFLVGALIAAFLARLSVEADLERGRALLFKRWLGVGAALMLSSLLGLGTLA